MINLILIIPVLASFLVVLLILPAWIRRAKEEGLVGKDIQKYQDIKVAEGGGIAVIAGFAIGVLLYVALKTFYFKTNGTITETFALLTTIFIVGFIGMIDTALGWKRGLGKRIRILMVLFAAIPLIVINVGRSDILLPIIGRANLGILYPLLLIPIGIVGATTTYNFLAGYNGLEAGQGVIILSALSLVAFLTGSSWLALIGMCMVASLLAFLIFNYYPAKVFPGDALTYGVGGLIAVMAILGNFEKVAIFFFMPYIIEFFLKARGRFIKQSFGVAKPDGSLDLRYNKFYGLEHIAIYLLKKLNVKATEKKVVCLIWGFQIILVILGLLIFREGIFLN